MKKFLHRLVGNQQHSQQQSPTHKSPPGYRTDQKHSGTSTDCTPPINKIHDAVEKGHPKKHIKKGAVGIPLFYDASESRYKCLNLLTKSGSDVNGVTLFSVVEKGNVKRARELIEAGADVNACSTQGTPLFYAASKGRYECVDLLIKSGADVNHKSQYGTTALMRAARAGCDKCLNLLTEAGVDVNASEITGNNALLEASRSKNVKSVQLIIKAGAEVNRVNEVLLEFLNKRLSINSRVTKKIAMLLFAAGQELDGATVTWFGEDFFRSRDDKYATLVGTTIEWCKLDPVDSTESPSDVGIDLDLKNKCREIIRKTLMRANPHVQLFITIPQLGLPSSINNYLLYYVPLEE